MGGRKMVRLLMYLGAPVCHYDGDLERHATVAVTGTFTVVGDCITAAVAVVMEERTRHCSLQESGETHPQP
jgi:hypothetical protein